MRLESALYSSREGISAHGSGLAVIGDNISNANTVGYKGSRTEFSDLYASQFVESGPNALPVTGDGVAVGAVRQLFSSGVIESTDRELDVAIDGGGFFILGDPNDARYSRAGNFTVNEDGFLVNSEGLAVLGLATGATELSPLNLANVGSAGQVTTEAALAGNLDATLAVTALPDNPETFNDIGTAASFANSVRVFDSLGGGHDVSIYFFKTGVNTFTVQAYMDGEDVGQEAGTPVKIGNDATLTFGTDGLIAEANQGQASIAATPAYANGAAAQEFVLDLSDFTQFASASSIAGFSQNGLQVGNVKGFQFGAAGEVIAVLDSGTQQQVGTLQLAHFVNQDGLERVGSTMFAATEGAGDRATGDPGTGVFGQLQGGSLERSNVDISREFVDLVLLQRGYQANSQTLTAANNLIRDTISLLR